MSIKKSRWSKVYESSEEELVAFLAVRNTSANRCTADEFEQLTAQTLTAPTDIYLAEGSASFKVNNATYSMQPGDTIHLPADTTLQISAGMSGCVYYQATR